MKKNLLTLLFVVAFLFAGVSVNEIKASTGFTKTPENFKLMLDKSNNKDEFNRKYVELKAFCNENRGSRCDNAVAAYDAVSGAMWQYCLNDPGNCQAYQDIAFTALDNAMLICRAEDMEDYPQAINFQKTELNQLQGLLTERRILK